jgi:ABC-type glycerol-3-phosphate transport system substrate-binding protein
MLIERNQPMAHNLSRQDFLKIGGAAALGGVASLADSAAVIQTLEAAAPTTLHMWIWETVSHWKKVVALSGLQQRFPNVRLEFTALAFPTLHQKLLTALTAGIATGLPDIARTHPSYYRALINTEAILDTTKEVGPYSKDIVPALYDNLLVKGKLYAVPDDFGAYQMGYRVDLFKKAGLPTEPDKVAALWPTWNDFIALGRKLESKLGVKLINVDPTGLYQNFEVLKNQGSTGNFDKDGHVLFDSPYYMRAAQIWRSLFKSGLVTTYVIGSPQYWTAHKQGKIATKIYPNWEDFVVLDFIPSTKGLWRVTRLPAPAAGVPRIAATDGVQLVIPTAIPSDRQKLALAVAKYLRLTVKATVAHMTSFPGAFVSYIPGLEAMRDKLSPVLDHQATYAYFLKVIREEHMKPVLYSASTHYAKADTLLQNAMFDILTKNAPISPTLRKAADQVRALQKSTGST